MRTTASRSSTESPPSPVDLYLVGHFARDEIVVSGRTETATGGGVYYGSIALRRMGLGVAVATRLHPDHFPLLAELRQSGAQVFATAGPATSGIENTYDPADMERRTCKPLGFAGPFTLADIPDVPAKVLMVTPITAGEVDGPLVRSLSNRAPLALDVQGFVRVRTGDRLEFQPWHDMAETLQHVTYLKADRAEAELLTGEPDLGSAARRLAALGPREVIVTESAGVTVHALGETYKAPFTPRRLDGRTGRGDTCFSTYVGRRLSRPPAEAAAFAAAVTSCKQETPGPWNGDMDAVQLRMSDTECLK